MSIHTSNWEWTKERSKYHFDYTRRDSVGEWYNVIGRFQGNWTDEVNTAIALSKDSEITWEYPEYVGSSKYRHSKTTYSGRPELVGSSKYRPMLQQEKQDLINAGADPKMVLTNVWDNFDNYPILSKIINFFQLEDSLPRLHIQRTGQMYNLHIDKLWERCPDDPSKVVRIGIMLEDWVPGQFYMFGTHPYTHWRAGECHTHDWGNVPHATANASNQPRPFLQITGLKTAHTEAIFSAASPESLYNV